MREPFAFLFCGRLLADKGLRELVQAAHILRTGGKNFVVRLAGPVDDDNSSAISRRELDGWTAEGSVEYLGMLDDVRMALAAAHCVVLPSYYREGVPRSLLEAAAMARPVITTDAPGCRDAVVAEKSGFLCKPRDVHSLARCMERMLALPPEALAAMGRAGREYMEQNFSEEIVLDAYVNALADIAPRSTAPGARL
ncbi:MAG TPA: glycosyltransferase [Gammaproteobacteria bacterium]|nr:glycosyltransferase [Gammaproteobacteria bacterium]